MFYGRFKKSGDVELMVGTKIVLCFNIQYDL